MRHGRVGEGVAEARAVSTCVALAGVAAGLAHQDGIAAARQAVADRIEHQRAIRAAQISAEAANAARLAEALRQERLENARLRRLLEQRQALIDSMMRGRRVA